MTASLLALSSFPVGLRSSMHPASGRWICYSILIEPFAVGWLKYSPTPLTVLITCECWHLFLVVHTHICSATWNALGCENYVDGTGVYDTGLVGNQLEARWATWCRASDTRQQCIINHDMLNHALRCLHGELNPMRLGKEENNDIIIHISSGVLSCLLEIRLWSAVSESILILHA